MKKAEIYLKKANEFYRCNIRAEDIYVNEEAALKAIKAAQIDAIEETVKRCAEVAELKEFNKTPQDRKSISNDMGDIYAVDKESILQVAEQLKKELEN